MPFRFLRPIPFLLLLLLAAFFAYGGTTPEPVELPLEAALALAIRNNLDLRVDALDSSIEESYLQRSKGIYDPSLDINVDHGQTFYTGETYGTKSTTGSVSLTQYLPTGGSVSASTYAGYTKPVSDFTDENWTDWYTTVGIYVSQPLLKNFGKETTELNITLASNDYEGSLAAFHDSVSETVYSVIKAYNRLYTQRQVLEERKAALTSAQQLLEKIKEQAKPGSEHNVEIANTEYAISQRTKGLVDARLKVSDSQASLRFLIGMKEKHEIIPLDPPSKEDAMETHEQAVSLAMGKRADLQQLRLDLKSREAQEKVSKQKLLPSLSVNASTGFRGIEDKFSDSVQQIGNGKGQWWSAGLQFNLPLGNTVAESDYRLSSLRTKQLKNQIAALEWRLRDDIEEDERALVSARIQMQVADKAFKAAKQRLKQYRQSLKRKKSNLQDVLNAENDLIYARNDQTQALEIFSNAVALFWKDVGVLLERKNINLNTREPEQLTAGTISFPFPLSGPQELKKQRTIAVTSATDRVPEVQAVSQVKAADLAPSSALAPEPEVPAVDNSQATALAPTENQESSPGQKPTAITAAAETITLYTLKIGTYASSELKVTESKVKSVGLTPKVQAGPRQARKVIRLFGGAFQRLTEAQPVLDRLLAAKAGGFLLNRGNKGYRLYGGSFFSQASARKEQQRLAALGIDLVLEESTVKLPTALLTAGRFDSREAADRGAQKLAAQGIVAVVQKVSTEG